jgi:hypothetical protein
MRVGDLIREEAQRGVQFASQGTIRIVEEGNELARGASPVEMAVKNQRANFHIETVMEWIPKERADISYEPGSLHMEYEIDHANVDWEHLEAMRLIFNPGSVEIRVEQHPNIVIEYVGDPIYVPPSANPNYEVRA